MSRLEAAKSSPRPGRGVGGEPPRFAGREFFSAPSGRAGLEPVIPVVVPPAGPGRRSACQTERRGHPCDAGARAVQGTRVREQWLPRLLGISVLMPAPVGTSDPTRPMTSPSIASFQNLSQSTATVRRRRGRLPMRPGPGYRNLEPVPRGTATWPSTIRRQRSDGGASTLSRGRISGDTPSHCGSGGHLHSWRRT